jgi:hypothetical protein
MSRRIASILAAVAVVIVTLPPYAGAKKHRRSACNVTSCTVGLAVEDACPCADAETHGKYVRCVVQAAKQLASSGVIERHCRGHVVSLAARAVCGHVDPIVCLVPTSTCSVDGTCTNDPNVDCVDDTDCGTQCRTMTADACDTANGLASDAASCTYAGCFSPSGAFLDADR